MEGCNLCENYQYGCCEDELTPALGLNKEVKRYFSTCLICLFHHPRAVAVKVPNMVVAWMEAWLEGQTLWVVLAYLEETVTCHQKQGPALTLLTSGSLTSIMVSKWRFVTLLMHLSHIPGGCTRFWYGGCEPGKNQLRKIVNKNVMSQEGQQSAF